MQEFKRAMENVKLSLEAKERIILRTKNNKKENVIMSRKKIGIIAAAAVMVMGIVAYAATGIIAVHTSHSSSTPEYTKVPTAQECIKDMGYAPTLIDEFANGYSFSDASVMRNAFKDENNSTVEEFASIMARYSKEGDDILLSAEKYESELEPEGEMVAEIDGTKLYFNQYTNKCVPPSYKLTEEDKKAEENGELVFSYGVPEVKIYDVQGLSFTKDGIEYCFTKLDNPVDMNEYIKMATEIINK